MDATQKQKMRKVAFIHLALTLAMLAGLVSANYFPTTALSSDSQNWYVMYWFAMLYLLQPHLFLLHIPLYQSFLAGMPGTMMFLMPIILTPVWCNCFAWIFIKTKDRFQISNRQS